MALLGRSGAGIAALVARRRGGRRRARVAADTAADPGRVGGLARVHGVAPKPFETHSRFGGVMTISSVRIPHATLIVGLAAALTAAALLWLSRTYNFYFDEWTFILTAPDWTWVTYLQPHNAHPAILFRLVYAALLYTVGIR